MRQRELVIAAALADAERSPRGPVWQLIGRPRNVTTDPALILIHAADALIWWARAGR